ncbi:MAG: YHS domain-containing protein, partial [Woeseiaceae bacterium]
MNLKSTFVTLTALLITGGNALAGDFTHSAPAVQGYDVVSYQTAKRPVRGTGHFVANYDGATYLFASQENLETFKKNPSRYAPAYNDYYAFG